MSNTRHITSFREFWPYYVRQHQSPGCRALHFVGTSLALACLIALAMTGNWWWLLAAPLVGYGTSWIGHFFVEHNRPAAFRYPLWSLFADAKMWLLMISGRMGREVTAIASASAAQ